MSYIAPPYGANQSQAREGQGPSPSSTIRTGKWASSRPAVRSTGEGHDDAMQRKMPPYMSNKPRLARTVTFNSAPDDISGSETATLDTKTQLEQHLEHESSSQHCSSLSILNLVRKGTVTHKRGTRIPSETSELSSIVDLPEALHEKKEYSRSKTGKEEIPGKTNAITYLNAEIFRI